MKYSECSDTVLEKEKETYTKGTEKYRLASDELKKRKRKRSRPKPKVVKKKCRDKIYIEAYGMTCKQIRELLGFRYSGTTKDLHDAGMLQNCIRHFKLRSKIKK